MFLVFLFKESLNFFVILIKSILVFARAFFSQPGVLHVSEPRLNWLAYV